MFSLNKSMTTAMVLKKQLVAFRKKKEQLIHLFFNATLNQLQQ